MVKQEVWVVCGTFLRVKFSRHSWRRKFVLRCTGRKCKLAECTKDINVIVRHEQWDVSGIFWKAKSSCHSEYGYCFVQEKFAEGRGHIKFIGRKEVWVVSGTFWKNGRCTHCKKGSMSYLQHFLQSWVLKSLVTGKSCLCRRRLKLAQTSRNVLRALNSPWNRSYDLCLGSAQKSSSRVTHNGEKLSCVIQDSNFQDV